jgi:hypothetical protein
LSTGTYAYLNLDITTRYVSILVTIYSCSVQEGVGIGEDGQEENILMLEQESSFGEVAILCNIPQPYTVRVCELCRLLRLDKESFTHILEIYFADGRKLLSNLTEVNSTNNQQDSTYFYQIPVFMDSAFFNMVSLTTEQ